MIFAMVLEQTSAVHCPTVKLSEDFQLYKIRYLLPNKDGDTTVFVQ